MPTPARIFLNYRVDRGQGHASTIRLLLEEVYGKESVFQDYHSINSGEVWSAKIPQAIREATVFLALVHGDEWLELNAYKRNRRLFREDDWVRKEIAIALEAGTLVIPILHQDVRRWPTEASDIEEVAPPGLEDFFRLQGERYHPNQPEALVASLQDRLQEVMQPRTHLQAEPSAVNLLAHLPLNPDLIDELAYLDSPYIGIPHFDEAHAPLFFGRDQEIWELYYDHIVPLRPRQVLLLHGASGVGKSSLLHGGLVPRLRYQGWYVGYKRRLKQGGATPLGLPGLLEKLKAEALQHQADQHLLILDQVEEMITDKGTPEEMPTFFAVLKDLLLEHPQLKVVLSFRKEYLADFKDQLKGLNQGETRERRLRPLEYSLPPLQQAGVRRAIRGVFDHPEIKRHFPRLGDLDPGLETALLRDTLQDEASHIAPLLQFQLHSLYRRARQAAAGGQIELKLAWYQPETSLRDFLEKQKLQVVETAFPEEFACGLIDDMLHFYTTPELTAASRTQADWEARYVHIEQAHPGRLAAIQQCLVDQYLLLRQPKIDACRLAHDALARIIRSRYEASTRPGQQAAFIIRAKEKLTTGEIEFSQTDITLIEGGRRGMAVLPGRIERCLQSDQQRYWSQMRERQNLALERAAEDLEHLRFATALNNLEIAAQEGIRPERVLALARYLPYPLLQLRQERQPIKTITFFKELMGPRAKLPSPDLEPAQLDAWLQADYPDLYTQMERAFFPAMVRVEGGKYQMGSKEGSRYFSREGPPHPVRVEGFYMGETPVTCWQYGLYCLDKKQPLPRDSGFGRGQRPVVNVNWQEALAYCNWLSERHGLEPVYEMEENGASICHWDRTGYRLPTEAEWEYAARERGKDLRFGNGQMIADPQQLNFDGQHIQNVHNDEITGWHRPGISRGATTPVQRFAPNALGLYDMSGNVFEWCWDGYDEQYYARSPEDNPRGPAEKQSYQVVRGGSWVLPAIYCRAAFRYWLPPIVRLSYVGFRVVRRLTL